LFFIDGMALSCHGILIFMFLAFTKVGASAIVWVVVVVGWWGHGWC
jgi:hypothetical protein